MARNKRHVSTPERAVELACDAIGEPKEVAVMLWPTKYRHRPESGADWLGHCLTPDRREKLDLCDVVAIFREAASLGDHEGFAAFAAMCGYEATPSDVEAELRRAREEAQRLLREAQQAASEYDELSRRPELLARMRAANLKVQP